MNKEEIKRRIKELKKGKVDLDYKNIKIRYRRLYLEAKQEFGSWKKAVKSTSYWESMHPSLIGIILYIIFVLIAISIWKFFTFSIDLLFLTIYVAVFIIGLIAVLFWVEKKIVNKIKEPIDVVTNLLFAFFMFMTFFITNKTYELSLESNIPKLTVQLTGYELPWGHFIKNVDYIVYEEFLNDTYTTLPVYVTINNYGQVPTQIYNIRFDTKCGGNKGVLSIPLNTSTLIKPGEFYKIQDSILIIGNKTIADILPCDITFRIDGPNFWPIEKIITLKKQEPKKMKLG